MFPTAPVMNRNCLSGKVFPWEQEFTGSLGAHWGVFNGERESGTCSRQGQRPVLGMFWHRIGGGSVQSSTETYQPQVQGGDKGPEGPVEVCVQNPGLKARLESRFQPLLTSSKISHSASWALIPHPCCGVSHSSGKQGIK